MTHQESNRTALIDRCGEKFIFQAQADLQDSSFGSSILVRVWPIDAVRLPGTGSLVRLYADTDEFGYGEAYLACLELTSPSKSARSSNVRKGILATARASQIEPCAPSAFGVVSEIRKAFLERCEQEIRPVWGKSVLHLVQAVCAGDRRGLFDDETYQDVKVCGLAHLVAVSGAHLVIVCGLVRSCCRVLRISQTVAALVQGAFLVCYLALTAMPISCVRAALMCAVALGAGPLGRRSYAAGSLSVIILLIIVADPSATHSLSFALSVLSTLGILMFMPLFSGWFASSSPFFSRWVASPLSMTIAALLPTACISATSFGYVSIVAPFTNILATPLVTGLCGLGTLACFFGSFPFVGSVLLHSAAACSWLIVGFTSFIASFPCAAVPLYIGVGAAAGVVTIVGLSILWLSWPNRITLRGAALLGTFAIAVCVLLSVPRSTGPELVMLDVGQGDAFIIRDAGRSVLVDTGNKDALLYEALARNGVSRLDAVLITHADDDHCGSLPALRGVVGIDRVFVAEGLPSCEDQSCQNLIDEASFMVGEDNIVELNAGSSFQVGSIECHVLGPSQLVDQGGNADSICLGLEWDGNGDGDPDMTGLMCGDAEVEVINRLIEEELVGPVDLLKVSHHGAKAALDDKVVDVLSPRVALVSVGADNRYGHPAPETIGRLESVGALVVRSDETGDAVCRFFSEGISVQTMR